MPKTPKQAGRQPRPGTRFLADAVAANIRDRRVVKRLSQGDLAERMTALGHQWTQTAVSDSERGQRNVTVDELFSLALALGTYPGDLVDARGIDGQTDTPVDLGPAAVPAARVTEWLEGRAATVVVWDGNEVKTMAIASGPREDEPTGTSIGALLKKMEQEGEVDVEVEMAEREQ